MPPWNVVLQLQGPGIRQPTCRLYTVRGIARPCRIAIYACDLNTAQSATHTHDTIDRELSRHAGISGQLCSGPGLWMCMTWWEKSCIQILVPVVGAPLTTQVGNEILSWQSMAKGVGVVTPALMPGIRHTTLFAGRPPSIARLNSVPWAGDPRTLAAATMQLALHGRRPGLFLSYRRTEAGAIVDQLHDELTHSGFRVFLDRFCGTPGRHFPQELAEEMADKAVVLVVETSGVYQSPWILWEVGFAVRYRLGLLAVNLSHAPQLSRIVQRQIVHPNEGGTLTEPVLRRTVAFVKREWTLAAVRRRGFYEGLVARAALDAGGTVVHQGNGLLELRGRTNAPTATVSPSGRPGRLDDVRRLAETIGGSVPKLLLGQHRHLPPGTYGDLRWLAQRTSTELLGDYDGYRRVRALC